MNSFSVTCGNLRKKTKREVISWPFLIMAGVWALWQPNTQIYPTFALDMITVTVIWTGATPEDVETAITMPIEQ